MFGDPLHHQFRFVLPKEFILPRTRQAFERFYEACHIPYEDVVDYLNSTIVNSKLPGLADPGDVVQSQGISDRSVRYPTSRSFEETADKVLDIDLRLRESYLNWLLLYSNFNEFLDRRKESPGRVFLPNVRLEMMDADGNVLFEFIYKELVFQELPALDASKTDNGLLTKDFTLSLYYNSYEVRQHWLSEISHRDEAKHHYY